ncbi:MAG: response regulator [Candidatus Stygibacter australis]|nr:response regulator [Candidatus Stygibacter australis]MDP8321115.1 response regulator [Candidatus Stygibacter australis]
MYNDPTLIEILLVDDDPGDIELTREALSTSKFKLRISEVHNGVECLDYLHKRGEYSDALKPDLILLDLNMPFKDGRETLKEIKGDPELRVIPIVILTTSEDDEDIVKTYASGANCFVTKPVGLDQLQKVVSMIESFWFTIVKFPIKDE